MARTHLLVGASRSIGAAVARHLVVRGDRVLAVSRGPAVAGEWVQADVSTDAGLAAVVQATRGEPLDCLLYLGGIWENGAFTRAYDFLSSHPEETRAVIAVNLTAPILLAQALAANLARAANPRVLLMGSLSGLPNAASAEVANSAAKFGLQGAAEALAIALRAKGIGVTVINPGNVATEEVQGDIARGDFGAQVPIPMVDLLATIDYILAVSADTVPSVINLAQKRA